MARRPPGQRRQPQPSRSAAAVGRRLQDIALGALLIVTLVLVAATLRNPPTGTTSASAVARPTALLLTGTGPGTPFADGARTTSDRLQWNTTLVPDLIGAFTSAGGGPGDLVVAARAHGDLTAYDHIVVSGGQHDVTADPLVLRTALLHLLDYLRARSRPDTSLTVIGAVPLAYPVEPGLQRVNDVLRDVARERMIHYVDPAQQRWTADRATLAADTAEALGAFLR